MTALTIIAIILALFLGMAIVVAVRDHYLADSLLRKNKAQQIEINGYREANIDPNSSVSIQTIPNLIITTAVGAFADIIPNVGRMIATTIKVFTDEDDDFNKREADELCEMHNS